MCVGSCNEVKYTVSIENEALDWKKMCLYEHQPGNSEFELFEVKAIEHVRNTTYLQKAGIIKFQEALVKSNDTKEFLYKYCIDKFRYDIALVDVIMDSKTAVKYVQALKVHFSDKIANFGKIIAA